jgi:tetratricopeptide (TPR) repeat protein
MGAPSEAPAADFGAPADFDTSETVPASEASPAQPLAPGAPPVSAVPPAPARVGPDPRIVQFLKQGDDAMARGNVQEAIDLWSRVFLIDLSNDEASQRIDRARDAQAENARKVDTLVSEGIQLYDTGDLTGARHKFLNVLAMAEGDATARSYLNQIDSSLATAPSGAPLSSLALSDFGSEDLAPAGASSHVAEAPLAEIVRTEPESDAEAGPEEERSAPARRTVDVRILLLAAVVVLVAIGLGTWFLLRKRGTSAASPTPVPATGRPGTTTPQPGGAAAPHAVDQAQALFDQGKVEEAQALAKSVSATDPRYPDALAFIAKMQSSAPPLPTPGGQTAASLDELRVTGLAAAKASRFIDAMKALDRVVKAHPEDVEAAQELARSRDQVAAMASAVKSFNESDYESAIKLLWTLRKANGDNKDVEEYLFKSYFNQGVQNLQAGNAPASASAFQEALNLHPTDTEAQRHLKFSRKYVKGTTELVAQIYVRHLTSRF